MIRVRARRYARDVTAAFPERYAWGEPPRFDRGSTPIRPTASSTTRATVSDGTLRFR
jgi:hypothetical protein